MFRKIGFCNEAEQKRDQEWMVSEWAAFNARIYSLEQDKDVPPTSQAEQDRDTNWANVARYAERLKELKFRVEQARLSPQHYGMLIKMPDLMGEPENWLSYEEYKAAEAERIKAIPEEAKSNLIDLFSRAAERGTGFSPAAAPDTAASEGVPAAAEAEARKVMAEFNEDLTEVHEVRKRTAAPQD